jgi:hypothetical protein
MKKILLFLFLTFISIESFSQFKGGRMDLYYTTIYENEDDFLGVKTRQLNLTCHSIQYPAESCIGIFQEPNGELSLYSYLYKKSWIFVDRIYIKLDGELFIFKSNQDRRDVMPQAYISELNFYDSNNIDNFIEKLKVCKSIEYRMYGRDYFIDFEFNKRRMRLAREQIDIFFKND